MSLSNALEVLSRIFFIALGIITIIDYLRHRDAIRRDVALLFGLLALPFLVQLIVQFTGQPESQLGTLLSIIGLVLEPYLLLRLIRYLRSLPAYMLKWAGYALIAVVACLIILPPTSGLTLLVTLAYLIGFNLYAMVGFVRGAMKAAGVARQRLRCGALGSGLFALVLIIIGLLVLFPHGTDIILLFGELAIVGCAVAFYIGFVPPRWLRRMWQLNELRDYLLASSRNRPAEDTGVNHSLQQLCEAANKAVNGISAGVIQRDDTAATWKFRIATDSDMFDNALAKGQHLIDQAMNKHTATSVYIPDVKDETGRKQLESIGAGTWLFVPMTVNQKLWGMLLVFLQARSLFIDDDLDLLELLTHENAIILTNYNLIAELQGYSEQLEHKVEERTAELTESENRYRELNAQLEQRVQDRTLQLEAANKEMEAFSYSVSHDLRSPLRTLNGFSQALAEDYAEQLDETAKDYLARIQAGSHIMSQLIEDLLALSHLTRGVMHHEPVDLSQLANQIVTDLRQQYPEQEVEFKFREGLVVNGDARLLRIALDNLLNNAWKYTSKQPKPQVEFGMTEQDGRNAYFVRDNGAGFDMTYAHKLFGVFQRLHSTDDFPGNGVGLATVQRIINRHGGKVWANAALNQGATFYFSL
jgi:signal transduction histidine kinase